MATEGVKPRLFQMCRKLLGCIRSLHVLMGTRYLKESETANDSDHGNDD
jgi:hypothetical protein